MCVCVYNFSVLKQSYSYDQNIQTEIVSVLYRETLSNVGVPQKFTILGFILTSFRFFANFSKI